MVGSNFPPPPNFTNFGGEFEFLIFRFVVPTIGSLSCRWEFSWSRGSRLSIQSLVSTFGDPYIMTVVIEISPHTFI